MSIFNKLRGGSAGTYGRAPQRTQFPNSGQARPAASTPTSTPVSRTYEKDSQGYNKMPSVESLGAPRKGMTFHSTPQGANSPLRHEVTSYGDMHTINTYGQTAKGEQRIGSFMTDQAPSFKGDTFSFGGGNTFDMATGRQAPGGAKHAGAKLTREWSND